MSKKYFQKDEKKFGVFKLKILYLHPLYRGRACWGKRLRGTKIFFQKSLSSSRKREKNDYFCTRFTEVGRNGAGGLRGIKKTFKKFRLKVGEEEKMITFAARFGGNGDKKVKRNGCPAGWPRYTGSSLTRWHQEKQIDLGS